MNFKNLSATSIFLLVITMGALIQLALTGSVSGHWNFQSVGVNALKFVIIALVTFVLLKVLFRK